MMILDAVIQRSRLPLTRVRCSSLSRPIHMTKGQWISLDHHDRSLVRTEYSYRPRGGGRIVLSDEKIFSSRRATKKEVSFLTHHETLVRLLHIIIVSLYHHHSHYSGTISATKKQARAPLLLPLPLCQEILLLTSTSELLTKEARQRCSWQYNLLL